MLGAVDLTDLDMWARAVPYEEFGRLRREAPVAWSPDEGSGFGGMVPQRPNGRMRGGRGGAAGSAEAQEGA